MPRTVQYNTVYRQCAHRSAVHQTCIHHSIVNAFQACHQRLTPHILSRASSQWAFAHRQKPFTPCFGSTYRTRTPPTQWGTQVLLALNFTKATMAHLHKCLCNTPYTHYFDAPNTPHSHQRRRSPTGFLHTLTYPLHAFRACTACLLCVATST